MLTIRQTNILYMFYISRSGSFISECVCVCVRACVCACVCVCVRAHTCVLNNEFINYAYLEAEYGLISKIAITMLLVGDQLSSVVISCHRK